MHRTFALALCFTAGLATAATAQPRVIGGPLAVRPAGGGLAAAVAAAARDNRGPVWVAWEVPSAATGNGPCCHEWKNGVQMAGCCALERTAGSAAGRSAGPSAGTPVQPDPVRLERSKYVGVYVRLDAGAAERVAAFSMDCAIDASGTQVIWLNNITPAESLAWLAGRVAGAGATNVDRHGELMAIAQHAGTNADTILLDAARNNSRPRVRAQALFWVAHKAGARVAGAMVDAVEHDPDTEVKTRAVFALSLMPKDEGIPRLITIAKTNRNVEVRRQAMFWLGQSKDARALSFFEDVLMRD